MPDPVLTPARERALTRARAEAAYADGFRRGWRGEPLGDLPPDPVSRIAFKLGWVDGGADHTARASGAGSYDEGQLSDLIVLGNARAELARARAEVADAKARLRQGRDAAVAWEFCDPNRS